MTGEIIFGIVMGLCGIGLFIYSIKLLSEDEIPLGIGVILFSIAFNVLGIIAIYDCSKAAKQGGYIHKIKGVKTVQIDTVVTNCKDVSDTTYVIKYLK